MSIVYPIAQAGGGGGGGDATSLRGTNISSNSPYEGQVLYYDGSEWVPRVLQNFITMYAAPNYFTSTLADEITKISFTNFINGSASVFLRVATTVENPYTGSISISGTNEGYILQHSHITSSNSVAFLQLVVSASSLYTVFASSSNASSQFKIYNILAAI